MRSQGGWRATSTLAGVGFTLVAVALAGCASQERAAGARPHSSSRVNASGDAAAKGLHVVATLKVSGGGSSIVAGPDRLWVLGGPSGLLTQVDPATNRIVRQVALPHPAGLGTILDGSLWVASLLDDAVMELDAASGKVLRTIESSQGKPFFRPLGIAAAGEHLWVVNHGDETVSSSVTRLDPRTGAVSGMTTLPGHHAGGPLVAHDRVWIAMTSEGTVVRVDPATGQVDGAPIAIDSGACISASAAGDQLWYTGTDSEEDSPCRNVGSRLDPASGKQSPVDYGPGRSLYEFVSAGGSVWASDIGHTLYRVDVGSGAIRPSLTLGGKADANRLVAAFGSIWVLGGETGQLTRVDVS